MTSPQAKTLDDFGYEQTLSRSLKLRDLVVYGLIFIVPIAPFGIFGHVLEASDGMIVTAYVVGLIGMLFTALSYAQMAERYPVAGSVYTYISQSVRPELGFLAGWMMLLDYVLIPALLYVVGAEAVHDVFPVLPSAGLLVAFVIFNTWVNIRGIGFTAAFNQWMLAVELLVLAAFLIVGVWAIGTHVDGARFSFAPIAGPHGFSLGVVISAVPIAVLSFLGFDGISTLSEEAEGGGPAIAKAIILVLLIIGGLFVAQTWVAALIAPTAGRFSNLDTAFYDVAGTAGGPWLAWLTALTTAIAWGVADSLVAQVATARLLFAMGRDRLLPNALARVHSQYRTPWLAALLVAVVSLIAGLGFMGHLALLTSMVTIGALAAFFVLNLAVIWAFYIGERSGRVVVHLICPLLGAAVIGYIGSGFDARAVAVGGVWLLVGILIYTVARARGREVRLET
ncbi:MAG: APC family permease [Salinisphaera sp.]|uniref:APC family permease n=1 Tax=Salinisphaera sp. TaxID=1914330 RepID=UPI003C7E64FD